MGSKETKYQLGQITDYTDFESFCNTLMAHCGYPVIEPLGGSKDKGRDALHVNRRNDLSTIFFYSVRKDWEVKLNEDLAKIKKHGHDCHEVIYVTNQGISSSDLDRIKENVLTTYGWRLDVYPLERVATLVDSYSELKRLHPGIFFLANNHESGVLGKGLIREEITVMLRQLEQQRQSTAFFYPLSIGFEVASTSNAESEIKKFPLYAENSSLIDKHFDVRPEKDVLKLFLDSTSINILLGEPGGGKSTLLTEWAYQLNQAHLENSNNPIAFLVRIRDVSEKGLVSYFSTPRDAGGHGLNISAYVGEEPPSKTVWLFDGLDELDTNVRNKWLQIIQSRSNQTVIATCRTRHYHQEFLGKPYYIMGLDPSLQQKFLAKLATAWKVHPNHSEFSSVSDSWTNEIVAALANHPSLRRLAGSPLLLTLIAETNPPSRPLNLPADRKDFYRSSFQKLLETRASLTQQSHLPARLRLFLKKLVSDIGLVPKIPDETLVKMATSEDLDDNDLEILIRSNILIKKGKYGSSYEFLHLTFQEWLLAEALYEEQGLVSMVKAYWLEPRYEEMLGIAWGIGTAEERDEATAYLLYQPWQKLTDGLDKDEVARSPLRIALHLWNRSGHDLKGYISQSLLLDRIRSNELIKFAIANYKETPQSILHELSYDNSDLIRHVIANHPGAREKTLAKLSQDEDLEIRGSIARNINTPVSILSKMIEDHNDDVLACVAFNPNTPSNVLDILANRKDISIHVCAAIASNPNTSVTLLRQYAKSDDWGTRQSVAENPSTPGEFLRILASDQMAQVSSVALKNPNIPEDVIANQIEQDESEFVTLRFHTADENLLEAAVSNNRQMRISAALNLKTPLDVLLRLRCDSDLLVQFAAARNPKVPLEILLEDCDTLPMG